jgi:hypothetical protein
MNMTVCEETSCTTLLQKYFVGCVQLLGGPNGERDIEDCEGGPDDPLHAILRKVRILGLREIQYDTLEVRSHQQEIGQ